MDTDMDMDTDEDTNKEVAGLGWPAFGLGSECDWFLFLASVSTHEPLLSRTALPLGGAASVPQGLRLISCAAQRGEYSRSRCLHHPVQPRCAGGRLRTGGPGDRRRAR